MIISKETSYAISTLLMLSEKAYSDKYVDIKEIAVKLNLPYFYLSKVLQKLVKKGFIKSMKGPKGGVTLNKDISELSIYDVIVAIENDDIFKYCILSQRVCNSDKSCSLHNEWEKIIKQLKLFFQNKKIISLPRSYID